MTQTVDVVKSVDDFLARYREAKQFVERFVLWPRRWREFASTFGTNNFNWQSFPFNANETPNIPNCAGVYTFSIEPRLAFHPGASFLMYVGKTERQTLRSRFTQYLAEKDNPKGRPHIIALLNEYDGYLKFHCTSCPVGITEDEAEQALQAGFIPPFCKQLPAEVSDVRRAFS